MKDWLPRLVARAPFTVHTKLNGAFFAIVALLIVFGFVVLQVLGGMVPASWVVQLTGSRWKTAHRRATLALARDDAYPA